MILTLIQGHGVIERSNSFSYSVVKLHEVAKSFPVVDDVGKMTAKKSFKYGECGSFACLLFLF